jgi:hypothetical protein
MRYLSRFSLVLCASVQLAGCAGPVGQGILASPVRALDAVIDRTSDNTNGVAQVLRSAYSAEPLGRNFGQFAFPGVQGGDDSLKFMGAAVSDSLSKCQNFVSLISAGQAVENTTLDIISIALSGLASVFVPVATVRALAAASTISQGTKSAINSNFFQQMTIVILTQKMENAFYTEMNSFVANSSEWANAAVAYPKLLNIHRKCSITYAASSLNSEPTRVEISATLSPDLVIPNMWLTNGTNDFLLTGTQRNALSYRSYDFAGKALDDAPAGPLTQSAMRAVLTTLKITGPSPRTRPAQPSGR